MYYRLLHPLVFSHHCCCIYVSIGPPGRETKRQIDQEKDFWTSTSANLKHNTICRDRSGIDDTARYITRWGPRGEKHPPPHYWQEYLNMQNQRENDMIDIFHASSARDAESHDSNHTSFAWNISQNVSKEKHRSATPGITSCITPGGDLFLPRKYQSKLLSLHIQEAQFNI